MESKRSVFHPKHAWDSLKTVFMPRDGGKRIYLILLAISIAFEIAPFSGKGQIEYLYVRTRFSWEVDEFSTFSTVDSLIGLFGNTNQFLTNSEQIEKNILLLRLFSNFPCKVRDDTFLCRSFQATDPVGYKICQGHLKWVG